MNRTESNHNQWTTSTTTRRHLAASIPGPLSPIFALHCTFTSIYTTGASATPISTTNSPSSHHKQSQALNEDTPPPCPTPHSTACASPGAPPPPCAPNPASTAQLDSSHRYPPHPPPLRPPASQ